MKKPNIFMLDRDLLKIVVVMAAITAFACGCATDKKVSGGDTVRVIDGVTGMPISGASVVVIYPTTGAGQPFKTDKNGIAHVQGGFGGKEGGIHIQASVPGGPMTSVGLWGVATNYVEIKMGPFKK